MWPLCSLVSGHIPRFSMFHAEKWERGLGVDVKRVTSAVCHSYVAIHNIQTVS